MATERIVVIFDTGFGEKLHSIATASPVWIINSAENDAAAQVFWQKGGKDVTTFRPQKFVDLLDTVDQHHAGWKQIEVIGDVLTEEVSTEARAYSVVSVKATTSGFLLARKAVV